MSITTGKQNCEKYSHNKVIRIAVIGLTVAAHLYIKKKLFLPSTNTALKKQWEHIYSHDYASYECPKLNQEA